MPNSITIAPKNIQKQQICYLFKDFCLDKNYLFQ